MSDTSPRIYLATPVLEKPAAFFARLDAALDASDVACVLLRFLTRDSAQAAEIIRAAAKPVQARGVALLIEGEPDLVLRTDADGLHVAGCGDALTMAIKRLAPKHIVGAGALGSRDEAMRAGEAGADYVLFGDAGADGVAPTLEATLERTRWWAEIFNTPCVALAPTLDAAQLLAAAGADFVMLGDCIWSDPRGPAAAINEAGARIKEKVA
ncbi:MAG: thiamine phosphate synthase [Methylocystis sp.]|nr:thiamine phosphate synthase [Methylocystis sp.]